jgi:hypothetical protein
MLLFFFLFVLKGIKRNYSVEHTGQIKFSIISIYIYMISVTSRANINGIAVVW